jgi:hypothetical protein
MIPLHIDVRGDGAWPELLQTGYIDGQWTHIAGLPQGTESGRESVSVRIALPDGTQVVAQTTLRLFLTAARLLAATYQEDPL